MIVLFSIYLNGQVPYIEHYGIAEGLPTRTVYNVFQDSRGFLWFATDAGAVRFDGTSFLNFRKKDGLGDNEIIRVKEDFRGRVWMPGLNGTLQFYEGKEIKNSKNTELLSQINSESTVRNFAHGPGGSLLFYDFSNHIYHVDSNRLAGSYHLPDIGQLYHMCFLPDDSLLLVTGNGFYITPFPEIKVRSVRETEIAGVYPVGDSTFFIYTGEDHVEYYRDRQRLFSFLIPREIQRLTTLAIDRDNMVWAGTLDMGVFCLHDGKTLFRLPIQQSQSIFVDPENYIWITSMNEGIYRIHPAFRKMIHFPAVSFDREGITALSPKKDGGLWMTNGRSIYTYTDGKINETDCLPALPGCNMISQSTDQILLAGAKNSSVYAFTSVDGKDFRTNPVLLHGFIKGFASNADGDVYFNDHKQVFRLDRREFKAENIATFDERIYKIFFNRKNELIINTLRGFFKYDGNRVTSCDELSVLSGKRISNQIVLSNRSEIFNTESDSIYLLSDDGLYNLSKAFTYQTGLPIKHIFQASQRIFFVTSDKIFSFQLPDHLPVNKTIEIRSLEMNFNVINDVVFMADTLFVASDDGLTLLPAKTLVPASENSPRPYITLIKVNDETADINQQNSVKAIGRSKIFLGFKAISFSGSPVTFSYMLEGLDRWWTVASQSDVVYQNLSPGKYVFRLRARTIGTTWSDPLEIPVNITPALYQRTIFYIICGIILWAILHYFIHRYRVNFKRRQELSYKLVTLEQKALRAMMNPHFIFNSLGSIQNYLLQNRAGEANLYMSQFARLIRQNLNAANSTSISLEDETDRLMNYLSLEKFRLDDKFEFELHIDEGLNADEVHIPSMIIQPFVENAVWHGISPLDGKGRISIRFDRKSDSTLRVTIEDNGIGIKKSLGFSSNNGHISLGMETTVKRLKIICKQNRMDFNVETEEIFPGRENPGTRISFCIPYTTDNE